MRRFLLYILLILSGITNAQVKQWSSPKKIKGAAIFTKVIGENPNGIFLLRYRNRVYSKNVILEKYNHLLVFQADRNFDLKRSRLTKVFITNDAVLMVLSTYNRKTQEIDLLGQWVDFDLKLLGKPIQIASVESQEYGSRGNYRLRISDDRKFISVVYHTTAAESSNYVLHQLTFSNKLKKLGEQHLELPYENDNFGVVDFGISNQGVTSILTKYELRIRRKTAQIKQSLFVVDTLQVHDFLLTDSLELKDATLSYNRGDDVHQVVALYGNPLDKEINGTLFFKHDGTSVYHQFTEDFLKKVNDGGSKKYLSASFEILESISRSDGGVLCVLEQKEIASENKVTMVNGIPQSTAKNIYNFNELLILNFDSAGYLDWSKLIKKNQTTINDGGYFSSAIVYVADRYIQLIYNDQLRNSGEIIQYTIFNNGKTASKKLLKTELDYVAVIPTESRQVASNKLIIPTAKNRRFALLKLIYQ